MPLSIRIVCQPIAAMAILILRLLVLTASIVVALVPPAPPAPTCYRSAADIPDLPPIDASAEFQPTPLDDAFLAAFRWTLRRQSGAKPSDLPGFDGMVEELLDFRRTHGIEDQEKVSHMTMVAVAGPIPFIYKHLFASSQYSPAVLAWFAKHLLPFLVGDMATTARSEADERPGGVLVDRCRVLEGSGCMGVCARMCKVPTERFFKEQWGVPLSMSPNFETGQCQFAFGDEPTPIEEDLTIPPGCMTQCPVFSFDDKDRAKSC